MRSCVALTTALLCPSLFAQSVLHDPTRPAFWDSSATTSSLTQETRLADANPAPTGRVAVLLLGKSKNLAVVDGITVKVGDLLHNWQVVSLSERGLGLRRDAQTQHIPLTPGVVKTLRPHAVASHPLEMTPREKP
jgi:hypothetical protein